MPRVLCTLPNASEEISGVKFSSHATGMLSEDVSDDVAEAFAAIPGYTVVGAVPAAVATDAYKAELLARAEAIAFKVKASWSVERLKTEVETAEAAHAEATAGGAN